MSLIDENSMGGPDLEGDIVGVQDSRAGLDDEPQKRNGNVWSGDKVCMGWKSGVPPRDEVLRGYNSLGVKKSKKGSVLWDETVEINGLEAPSEDESPKEKRSSLQAADVGRKWGLRVPRDKSKRKSVLEDDAVGKRDPNGSPEDRSLKRRASLPSDEAAGRFDLSGEPSREGRLLGDQMLKRGSVATSGI